MSRGALECMLQVSTIQLMSLLNAAYKVVDNVCTFLQNDYLNVLNHGSTIFTRTMSFKVFNQLENLTPVWKYVEIELSPVSCLNNLERLNFVICLHTKDILFHHPRNNFAIFGLVHQNVNYFPAII